MKSKFPFSFWAVLVVCCLTLIFLINKWRVITDGNYYPFITLLIISLTISTIVFIISCKRKELLGKRIFRYTILGLVVITLLLYTDIFDKVLIYSNFYLYKNERENAVKTVLHEIENDPYNTGLFYLKEKYKGVSYNGWAQAWRDRGCLEVDFKVYNGGPHGMIDLFSYDMDGHFVYVTDEAKFNKSGASIRKVLSTLRITDNWYFVITTY